MGVGECGIGILPVPDISPILFINFPVSCPDNHIKSGNIVVIQYLKIRVYIIPITKSNTILR